MPEPIRPAPGWIATALRTLAACGYGVWMLLGLGLALGIYSIGRGEALVPLLLGAVFVSLGPLLASLGMPALRGWRGWRLERGLRPDRDALLALACYLPVFGVAGLVHGSNDFWATRLAAVALTAGSLACVVYARRERAIRPSALVGPLSLDRAVAACYGGGLWLLLCVVSQDPAARIGGNRDWIIGLLLLALLLGLVEGMRWQALAGSRRRNRWWRQRYLGALLTYAVPCVALLATHFTVDDRWPVLIGALACVLGRSIERRLYRAAAPRPAPTMQAG
ncbi:hypothetical protein QMK61_11580 [Fulvimonas sp. R45]|uniref:hypothetical protein n=1 Tax=Fulvimonas sp. R45 TaxID=3045937 RepID=UPI00265DA270|nr:hypothetical protein [Fulvimonas sp. R45]MDO1529471.1 hypothetical protein [Fulvimonas sp. R45]